MGVVFGKYIFMQTEEKKKMPFDLTLIVTHNCNLSCIYCYEHNKQSAKRMTIGIAKDALKYYLTTGDYEEIKISFIGGEPLLEFNLIKDVCEWIWSQSWTKKLLFFATTNGTVMTQEMKEWFVKNRKRFWLGLSLDGDKPTHDANRCNSFDLIDLDFFLTNWPEQPIKMTISDKNLNRLADDVIFIQERGFQLVGCNFAEGYLMEDFESKLPIITEQYDKLVDYYITHEEYNDPHVFNMPFANCETRVDIDRKRCGTGDNMAVIDYDGKKYPCTFFSPISMSDEQLAQAFQTDFHNSSAFIDKECYENCYIYPICHGCYGDNFCTTGNLSKKSYQKCALNKVKAMATAKYKSYKLSEKLKNATEISETDSNTIKAILKINSLFY